jgi:Cu2+-exporting ATPase
MDIPVALGLLVTFVASSGATFDPQGPFGHEVYFDSLTMFVSFLLAGRFLEMSARHRAAEALEDTLSACRRRPFAWWDRMTRSRPSACAPGKGDRVRVPVGAAFPADGRLEEGAPRRTNPC